LSTRQVTSSVQTKQQTSHKAYNQSQTWALFAYSVGILRSAAIDLVSYGRGSMNDLSIDSKGNGTGSDSKPCRECAWSSPSHPCNRRIQGPGPSISDTNVQLEQVERKIGTMFTRFSLPIFFNF